MLMGEPIPELQERLGQLLQVLIQRYKHKGRKQPHSPRLHQFKDAWSIWNRRNNVASFLSSFSSLVVEKQPPQVIKTQSKFSTTVRYLLGEKIAPGKPVVLKAQIINESQARSQGSRPRWVMQSTPPYTGMLSWDSAFCNKTMLQINTWKTWKCYLSIMHIT